MLYCLIGRGDATGGFITHLDARFLFPSLDGVAHDKGSFRRSVDADLTGRSLDKVATCSHGEDRCFPNILCCFEESGLEDDFEVVFATNSFYLCDFIETFLITSLEEFTYREDDVHFGSTGFECKSSLCDFDLRESLGCRESCAAASDIEFRVFECFAYILCHSGIDADSCHIRYAREFRLESVDRIRHPFYFRNGIVSAQGRIVNLMEAFLPNLDIVVLSKMLCFDVSHLSFYLLIGKRAGILRK